MTLQRKTPMKRSGWKSSPAKSEDWRSKLRNGGMKRKGKAKTKAEREHMGVVAGLYCIVCRNLRLGDSPAEVHHVRYLAGGGQKSTDFDTIPLCPSHHRLGGHGVAIHAGQETWERNFGTEAELLEQTRRECGQQQELEVA